MTMKKLLAFSLVALPATALAGDPKPGLPPQVAVMECLVGNWKGTGTVAMGKDKAKVDLTWNCKRTPGDFGVLCALHATGIPGVASYDETDLMGYEPGSNTYHWFSVTNAGETHDHVAKATDGNQIRFVYTGTQDGKPFKEVIDMTFAKDGTSITGRAETFVAGKSTTVFELAFAK
jgi:hypothetical protein